MNTLHFKYAVEVERTGSITQAADNLYMAQPNLSKAIKELEDTLGIEVFKRTSKGMVPTKKGAAFLIYAKKILAQLDEVESLCRPDNEGRQRFNISIPRVSYIAKAITRFVQTLDALREIDVNIQETNSINAIRNISEGRFNLGIIRYKTDYENYFLDFLAQNDIKHETVWEFDYMAVMSEKHPLAHNKEIRFEDFSKYIEIAHGDTNVPYLHEDIRKNAESEQGKKVIYVYERCSQFDLLVHVPGTYMWVSPIPDEFLKLYGLVQRRCYAPNNRCKDLLIYSKGYPFSELDKRFVNKLFEARNEVAFREYI